MGQSLNDPFTQEIERLRVDYERKREQSNLGSAGGRQIVDLSIDLDDGVLCYTYWYEHQCIRLADIPGTLSGDILRLHQNLPSSVDNGDHEIIGDDIRLLKNVPPLPELDDDSEDLDTVLTSLPIVCKVDASRHFVKKGKYKSEIENLLKCQGGSCPGVPISSHIIQLLGKSPEGMLVFDKFVPRYFILGSIYPLSVYKDWILQIISGMKQLHSLGIVHRDLRIDNVVFSSDKSRVLICDLESRWGNHLAPEVSRGPVLDAGWTERSDIYDLGYLIKGLVYGNSPVTFAVEWPVPPTLAAVVEACTCERPEERPSLDDIYAMVDKIKTT
ncbi:kinase-like protein [Xylona heveae TC161]|uniref:EKC/KEOPS complex subunit BUD32 n=1 Tax=Xylona heveae (strain CBS 132557 / TC161) TaxID=1328760 RepID=A0A164ZIG0_XYLHT|nr:kinase-like protein [Xylona heveae TC161]KZF19140.1 kinase-like protein [Xylona heveae TC161]